MSSIDWNNPEERNAYYRKQVSNYRKTHPRLQLTFSQEEYETILSSATKYGINRRQLAKHVRLLAIEAARMGLGERFERPPALDEESKEEMLYLLHNCANNINQIAHHLNSKALEYNVREVAGEAESQNILDGIFDLLKETHTNIKSLSDTPNPSK